jgi:hypothetical protein
MEKKKRNFNSMMGEDTIITNGSRCPNCNLIISINNNSLNNIASTGNIFSGICSCKHIEIDKYGFLPVQKQRDNVNKQEQEQNQNYTTIAETINKIQDKNPLECEGKDNMKTDSILYEKKAADIADDKGEHEKISHSLIEKTNVIKEKEGEDIVKGVEEKISCSSNNKTEVIPKDEVDIPKDKAKMDEASMRNYAIEHNFILKSDFYAIMGELRQSLQKLKALIIAKHQKELEATKNPK